MRECWNTRPNMVSVDSPNGDLKSDAHLWTHECRAPLNGLLLQGEAGSARTNTDGHQRQKEGLPRLKTALKMSQLTRALRRVNNSKRAWLCMKV